jgi:inner membrane protein
VALAAVCVLDVVLAERRWPVLAEGLLDEPAHLLTAWLVLAALLPGRLHGLLPWALLGSVVIDLDHVALYIWRDAVGVDGGRPFTHSLVTVAALALAAAALRHRRVALAGLAVGVLLHLLRDLAGGPGVPLLWPWLETGFRVPPDVHLAALAAVTLVAVVRRGAPGHTLVNAPRA